MDKPIDLKDSLTGHVILWAKGWYHERNQPRTIERLYEVVNSITGMPDDHKLNVREILTFLMDAIQHLKINPRYVAEAIARETAFENKRLTSYNVRMEDFMRMDLLITTLAGLVSSGQINDGKKPFVLLPDLNEAVRKKYNLTKFNNLDL